MFSPQLMLSFIHIPKTAGSSLLETCRSMGICSINIGHTTIDEVNRGYSKEDFGQSTNLHSLWGEKTCKDIMGSYKFTIVRNPYDRMRSHYSFAMRYEKDLWGLHDDFSFNDYIFNCPSPLALQRVFWSQCRYVMIDNKLAINEFIKFENMHSGLAALFKKFKINYSESYHKLNSDSTSISFTPEIKEHIYQRYEPDFKTFGYKK